nr:hypothetical protein [Streptomyces chartreusis]
MANGVYHTGCDIEINLTREDLGNPDYDGLLEEIIRPVGERPRHLLQCLKYRRGGQCQCARDGKTPWMFIRRQRRDDTVVWVAAHLPLTHADTPEESDKHKAMKERIARTASRHGLDVQTEARSDDGRVITDVLVTGAGGVSDGRPSTPPSPPAPYAVALNEHASATLPPCGSPPTSRRT